MTECRLAQLSRVVHCQHDVVPEVPNNRTQLNNEVTSVRNQEVPHSIVGTMMVSILLHLQACRACSVCSVQWGAERKPLNTSLFSGVDVGGALGLCTPGPVCSPTHCYLARFSCGGLFGPSCRSSQRLRSSGLLLSSEQLIIIGYITITKPNIKNRTLNKCLHTL